VSEYPASFDAAYSVSDIHLGGAGSFQIFNHGPRLARFIDHVTAQPAGKDIVLVLNGDVIDSLAEPGVGYVALDEDQALNMIERIMADRSFVKVWDALAAYVRTARRHLVIVGGNHDIELGLPIVEGAIRNRLCGDDQTAQSRLVFSGRGSGYTCRVGEARVFFTHGNELDRFNRVDNEKLGQLALAQNAGRKVDPDDWTPNMGTRLVVDVMNDIKREHPFIDLLKPETGAVYGVLLVMGPKALRKIDIGDLRRLFGSVRRSDAAGGDLLRMDLGGVETAGDGSETEIGVGELLGPRVRGHVQAAITSMSEDELLVAVDNLVIEQGSEWRPSEATELSDAEMETLGVRDVFRGVQAFLSDDEEKKKDALRDALLDWRDEEGLFGEDALEIDDRMSDWLRERTPGAHFTVAGHTHKARSIEIRADQAYYLNSGTWIRILELPEQALDEGPNFDAIWQALMSGTLDAIDKARVTIDGTERPVTMDFATAVKIEAGDREVTGEILRVGRSGPPKPVDDSQRTVRF